MARNDWQRYRCEVKVRIARRFRHHIRTQWNPNGRIHREPCGSCGDAASEAHHVDYDQPFLVAWLCFSCHRRVDHGGVRLGKRMLWDYNSLIANIIRPSTWVNGVASNEPLQEEGPC